MRFLGILVTFLVAVVASGIAIMLLWEWFISDYFGLKQLSIPEALGLSIAVHYLTDQGVRPHEDDNRSTEEKLLYGIFVPVLAIALGWLIHLFV